jgi:hypothetical protein
MKCRNCQSLNLHEFVDLGFAPPSNAYLNKEDLKKPEVYYPLKVAVCVDCWLVQTEDYLNSDEIFKSDYAYFSSTSSSWLSHAATFSKNITNKLNLNQSSMVIEIASNDGYLLKNFLAAKIPCLGIEPTESTAHEAQLQGIPTRQIFFTEENARKLVDEGYRADLIIGNNVFAHVPDINNFTRGLKIILKSDGVVSLEFPHFLELIKNSQFDTIYHEHFSYLSLKTVLKIFQSAGLMVVDVEKIPTHGGSLRIYVKHLGVKNIATSKIKSLLDEEANFGLNNTDIYSDFQIRVDKIKLDFLNFLITKKEQQKTILAYGAAAKGNTLLNYSGVKQDLVPFVCDAAIAKQGKYMPGSHIPIMEPEYIIKSNPDYILILPWNIADEVINQLSPYLPNTKFVTAIPELRIF